LDAVACAPTVGKGNDSPSPLAKTVGAVDERPNDEVTEPKPVANAKSDEGVVPGLEEADPTDDCVELANDVAWLVVVGNAGWTRNAESNGGGAPWLASGGARVAGGTNALPAGATPNSGGWLGASGIGVERLFGRSTERAGLWGVRCPAGGELR